MVFTNTHKHMNTHMHTHTVFFILLLFINVLLSWFWSWISAGESDSTDQVWNCWLTQDLTPEHESTVFPPQMFSFGAAFKFKPRLFEAFHCAVNNLGSEKQEPSVFCNMWAATRIPPGAGCWETRCLGSSWTMQSDSGSRRRCSRSRAEPDAPVPATSPSHSSEAPRSSIWRSVRLRSCCRRRRGAERRSGTFHRRQESAAFGPGRRSESPEGWNPRIDQRERVSYQRSLCNRCMWRMRALMRGKVSGEGDCWRRDVRRIYIFSASLSPVFWCAEMLAAGAASAPSVDGEDAPEAPNFGSVPMGSKSRFCVRIRTLC